MRTIQWTQEEDDILSKNYQLTKKEIVKLLPNRTSAAINIRASKLGLKKIRNEYCQSKLDILLEDTFESFYWIGFILADGSIVGNRLKITLAKKDERHVDQVAKYLQTQKKKNKRNQYYISCQDKFIVPKIKDKFNIQARKTYNPSKQLNFNLNLLLSMFIGYIDGDGSIRKQTKRKDSLLTIQVHKSWLTWLNHFQELISKETGINLPKPYLNKRQYAFWAITHSEVLSFLKKFVLKYKLPVLNRKWDCIDETFVSRNTQAKETKNKVLQLKQQKHKNSEIANMLKISKSYVTQILKKGGLVCG